MNAVVFIREEGKPGEKPIGVLDQEFGDRDTAATQRMLELYRQGRSA